MTALDRELPDDISFEATEREQSQLPAAALLSRLGYTFLSRKEALALRGGKTSRVLLEDILRAQLARINVIRYKEREYPFSPANIGRAIRALEEVPLVEGVQRAGEQAYDLMRLGKSLEQTVEGDTKSFSLRYIDWDHPENNAFHATIEYEVQRAASMETVRLDVVLFVNGIPFVVAECKARGIDLDDAISDLAGYQSADYVPDLFKYVQLLLAVNGREAKYATTGTEARFWSVWKVERQEEQNKEIRELLAQPLPDPDYRAVMASFVREQKHFYAVESQGRQVTEQDRALYNLCRSERLLDLVRRFIVYEGGTKKIARYQQYEAVTRAIEQIRRPREDGSRQGGVIWHTQGSGKSLTMVMLANAIAMEPSIINPRIILVTDSIDLDKQIQSTFRRCGLEAQRASSGADLRRLLKSPRASIITTLVHKFQASLTHGDLADDSPEIFVLVDESQRTQYGTLHSQMKRVLPKACYIGFTGTPLLREDKNTIAKFGGLIDTYTMEEAVADKAVVPLLYERRYVPQEVNDQAIDTWFERKSEGLTDAQKADLKRKYSRLKMLSRAEQRLAMVAYDISEDYRLNWQTADHRFKAQLVAPDRLTAVKLHELIRELGHVETAVLISGPEEKEGYEDPDQPTPDKVRDFWKQMMQKYGTDDRYNDEIRESFKGPYPPDILIVVDKLITGFDAPRNTVLYLDRHLANHTLLQAIARVNRLYEGKSYGYIIDYVGVLGELDRALGLYQKLANYDPQDLIGILRNVRDEVQKLPQLHAGLLDIFKSIRNKSDAEEYELLLADEALRNEFYDALAAFSRCLRVALSSDVIYEEFTEEAIERYKADLRRFQKLRASVQRRYADIVDTKKLDPQIAKLLDTYVSSDSVEVLTAEPVDILDAAAMEKALAALGTQATPAAKADTIAHAMARTITVKMDEDPALYRKFSEMLRETIEAFRNHLITEMDYLHRVRALRDQLASGTGRHVPESLIGHEVAQAYFRIVKEKIGELSDAPSDDLGAEVALMIAEAIVKEVVVDWRNKDDVKNRMRANIDDGFFELSQQSKIKLDWAAIDEIATEVVRIAKSRLP